ncbi:hypothetical protein QMK19_40410 [Streptomyces sp. H10-C2]|uniref:hypothetical protein n=1 Tax=unclassified Streptomyces TaxID=2593676 RepID=UPI0024BAF1FD|nr:MULTISPECIES: hypothetical protein [unclassified Streptomyces]MDJ0347446.1 hypothetical protein [Streptomyces sp. PH10-H1]MDJ0375672.1 hypothetical protein [Streptomyces sp. H10-C2]
MPQRIDGVTPPYEAETARSLHAWMPPEATQEPLMLFKVLERHPDWPRACGYWVPGCWPTAG